MGPSIPNAFRPYRLASAAKKTSMSYIDIAYNACYGGFGLSQEARAMYLAQCPDAAASPQRLCASGLPRHDPVLARIVRELGSERASDRYAKVRLAQIPACYVGHYTINEYDGTEDVVIEYNAYKVDQTRAILGDRTTSKAEKLARIAAVMAMEDEEVREVE